MESITLQGAEPFFLPAGNVGCLLVHGFTGAPQEMRLMGDFLHSHQITSYGIRLAGHGTDIKDMPKMKWRDWLVSVEDGVHTLRGLCDQVFIAGLSMGGLLSLMAASYLPLQGVIAMSTPYQLRDNWRIKLARPLSLFVPFVDKGRSKTVDQETAKNHIDYPAYPTLSIAELKSLLLETHKRLSQINIPILMINSKSDKTVPETHQQKYANQLKSKDFKSLLIEKSGHVITEDVEREIVFQNALNFIHKNI